MSILHRIEGLLLVIILMLASTCRPEGFLRTVLFLLSVILFGVITLIFVRTKD